MYTLSGSIPDLNHSKALEGGRVQIVLRGDHQDTELGREDSEEEDVSSDSEEEKMSATPPIVRKLSARGSSSSSQPDPPARQGSSRSGRRRITLPGYLEVNKRIRQSLLDTDDSDEGDEYKPPGELFFNLFLFLSCYSIAGVAEPSYLNCIS